MNPERAHERPPAPQNSRAPDFLAHWVVKTTRTEQMIDWYRAVFGGRVIHQGTRIAFIAWDDEHHRIALIKVPKLLRVAFPLARFRRKLYGIDHIAVHFESVERLLVNYERLRRSGISPVWSINHGPTSSLYYEDPTVFDWDSRPTTCRRRRPRRPTQARSGHAPGHQSASEQTRHHAENTVKHAAKAARIASRRLRRGIAVSLPGAAPRRCCAPGLPPR